MKKGKQRGWAHGVLVSLGTSREQARGQHGATDFSQSIGRRIRSIFLLLNMRGETAM
jgi:hypothetical protein